MGLTKKQKQVYDYIQQYLASNGYSPSQEEIRKYFGLKSLGSVQKYLQYLVNARYLQKSTHEQRSLIPLQTHQTTPSLLQELPLLGEVAAGRPIETVVWHETYSVPPSMVPKGESFCLKVKGESMIEDGIHDGDILIIQKSTSANNGDTIVALVNNEATVKRYFKKNKSIELHPANKTMTPIKVSQGEFKI